MNFFELVTYGMVGIGLAASCGFRVFVPMLFMSVAVHVGSLILADGWEWIGSWPALAAFGVATLVEVCGFFIPWLDNLLDAAATPAAVIGGILATTACVSQADPVLAWSFGIIAGGGAAAVVQSGTVLARGTSTATTGGAGNFLVAGGELVGATVTSILAIVAPLLACLLFAVFAAMTAWLFVRWRRKRRMALAAVETDSRGSVA